MVERRDIAQLIDQSLLKPDVTEEDVRNLCEEAKQYGFASVFINPFWVPLAVQLLKDSPVRVGTVAGFPLGASTTATKVFQAKEAISKGADEIDMVMNVGALKSGDDKTVGEDIEAVVDAAGGKTVKVILETCLLSQSEKVRAALLAKKAGAHFVKTSTGFASGGATVEDVALLRKTVGEDMGVKASGGIRDLETVRKLIDAGATRIGTSSGVDIIRQSEVSIQKQEAGSKRQEKRQTA